MSGSQHSAKRGRPALRWQNEKLAYRICELGIREKLGFADIRIKIMDEFEGFELERHQLQALISEMFMRGYLLLNPPRNEALAQQIAAHYHLPHITVVDTSGATVIMNLATVAGCLISSLIKELHQEKQQIAMEQAEAQHKKSRPSRPTLRKRKRQQKASGASRERKVSEDIDYLSIPIHVGIAAGLTTKQTFQEMGKILSASVDHPPLTLHALSANLDCCPRIHQFFSSPDAIFASFAETVNRSDLKYVGFSGPPFVDASHENIFKELPSIRDAFAARDDIDIIVTSLGDRSDEHTPLYSFLNEIKGSLASLPKDTWVGDILYQPYGKSGAVEYQKKLKPFTLFNIEELRCFKEKPNKCIVLICGPCGQCGRSKFAALLPLLEYPELHLFTHLIMDIGTAEEISKHINTKNADREYHSTTSGKKSQTKKR